LCLGCDSSTNFPSTAHTLQTKKAPILRLGLSGFGKHKQTRNADLYSVHNILDDS